MVNAACSEVNSLSSLLAHIAVVDSDVWPRIKECVSQKPGGSGREVAWLAEKLQTTQQRVFNWTKRGVPSSALPDIAAAVGMTVGQLLGMEDPPQAWPFRRITQEAWAALDAYDQAAVEEAARQKMRELQAEREAGATGKRRTLAA